ncbi:MAG: hypothetical protein ABJA67_17070 [Chthonomonadales bacterium]
MKRGPLIALGICAFLLIYLLMVGLSMSKQSVPDMNRENATIMLNELGSAFQDASPARVLAFAAPEATVAGQDLDNTRKLLVAVFRELKHPRVDWSDINVEHDADRAHVTARVEVRDGDTSKYDAKLGFVIVKRTESKLFGLVKVDRWKILSVDAPNIPDIK